MASLQELKNMSMPSSWLGLCPVCHFGVGNHFYGGYCPMPNGNPPHNRIGALDYSLVRGRYGVPLDKEEVVIIGVDMAFKPPVSSGAYCSKCNEFNSYAENTSNYICYSCRH